MNIYVLSYSLYSVILRHKIISILYGYAIIVVTTTKHENYKKFCLRIRIRIP